MQHADRDTRWMLAGGAVLAIAVVCGSLALAGVRLDDRDAAVPAASAGERARQGLAEKVARLRASASALQTAHPEVPQYATIADRAKAYSAAVGGVWRPWPSGAPSGRTNPPVATAGPLAPASDRPPHVFDGGRPGLPRPGLELGEGLRHSGGGLLPGVPRLVADRRLFRFLCAGGRGAARYRGILSHAQMHFPARSRRVRITPPRAMSSRIDRGSLNAHRLHRHSRSTVRLT